MTRQKYKNLIIILFHRNLGRVINLVMDNQLEKKPKKHHHFEEIPNEHHQLEEIPNGHHQLDDGDYEWNDWDEWEEYYHDMRMVDEEVTAKESKFNIVIILVFLATLIVISSIFSAHSR